MRLNFRSASSFAACHKIPSKLSLGKAKKFMIIHTHQKIQIFSYKKQRKLFIPTFLHQKKKLEISLLYQVLDRIEDRVFSYPSQYFSYAHFLPNFTLTNMTPFHTNFLLLFLPILPQDKKKNTFAAHSKFPGIQSRNDLVLQAWQGILLDKFYIICQITPTVKFSYAPSKLFVQKYRCETNQLNPTLQNFFY